MPASNRRRLRRIIGYGIAAVVLLLVAAVAIVLVLVRTEPAHWKAHQAYLQSHTPEQIAEVAASVEQRILELTQSGAPNETNDGKPMLLPAAGDAASDQPVVRTMHFAQHELNAWVVEKFHEWLTYRDYDMPDQINDPMLAIENGRLVLSFELHAGDFHQVFSAGFDITFEDKDVALLELRDVMAGNLSIPSDGIGDYLRNYGPDDDRVTKVADWLDKLDRLEFKPSMKLGDSHKATVLDYQVVEDGVDVTLRLEPRPSYIARQQMIAAVQTDME